ncbi:hypothetical protein CMV_029321 [Castanea mollissima]|uniref:Glycoside hydrolase family 19 catalytic domain-containing protein n=1 Tax=Castanea mollissima TaxID=60419 RepID=A0A8J4V478_9ROSI|nr:hypothetical protein CMV_029321 [Castanea mollissima]
MEYKRSVLFTILAFIVVLVNCNGPYNRQGSLPKPCPLCNTNRRPGPGSPGTQSCCDSSQGVELVVQGGRDVYYRPNMQDPKHAVRGTTDPSKPGRCCHGAVRDYLKTDQFENMFSKRNSLEVEAHAKGFWDYQSFITASAHYQPYGFGTTYMNRTFFGTKEVAAFLAHAATKTSCENKVATNMEKLEWGLCYNKEKNSNSNYCDEHYKKSYPCAPGVAYYGRGALPIYWNYNYGEAGKDLKVDLLNHPEYIEQNSTLAFQVAIWRWMTPIKKHQPSAHDVFIGYWTPTKNDTLAKRVSGFGATMNVLYGDLVCGQGDNESMKNFISHYLYYLGIMGVDQEEAKSPEVLTCADQVAFNPSFFSNP